VLVTRQFTVVIDLYIFFLWKSLGDINSGYQHSLKHLLLCSAEEINSYRFWTTWGWCCWTIPLKLFIKYLLRNYDWRMSKVFADFFHIWSKCTYGRGGNTNFLSIKCSQNEPWNYVESFLSWNFPVISCLYYVITSLYITGILFMHRLFHSTMIVICLY